MIGVAAVSVIAVTVSRCLWVRAHMGAMARHHPDRDVEMSLSDKCIWLGLTSHSHLAKDGVAEWSS